MNFRNEVRSYRHVKDHIGMLAKFLFFLFYYFGNFLVVGFIAGIHLEVRYVLRKGLPFTVLLTFTARELLNAIEQMLAKFIITVNGSANTYDREFLGHPVIDK